MASTIVVDKIQKTGGVAFVLPAADGSAGQLLKTDGSLNLGWATDVDTGITSVAADSSPALGGFLDANGNYIQMQKGPDIASASPTVILTTGDYFICTGTTGFSAMTVAADRHFFLEFAGALIMTHGAGTLDLPSGANITTAAGDVAEFVSTASNVVTCVNYSRASGKALVGTATAATTSAAGLVEQSTSAENVTRTADDKFPSVLGVSEIVSKIPQRSLSAAEAFVIADAGKHILHPSADTSARTFTIPANSSVAYEVGTAITIVNQDGAGVITLAITSDELRWYPDNSTGSRTITAPALVNLLKVAATEWVLTGVGIS